MEKETILTHLISVIEALKGNDGWTDLAVIGKPLAEKGLNYKALGYLKLRQLIEEFPNNIEIKKDTTHGVPVLYAKIKSKTLPPSPVIVKEKTLETKTSVKITSHHKATKGFPLYLNDFAYLKDYSSIITNLKNIALKERWYYKEINPNFPYPILANYFTYTYYRLAKEKDKIMVSGNWAAFNTGLVDKRYEPIYALFMKNLIPDNQEWYFDSFCIPGEDKAGKTLVSYFNPLPQRAHYFDNITDMIYDTASAEPKLDWSHIILENVKRLPIDFLVENKPNNYILQDTSAMTTIEKSTYYTDLAKAIENDEKKYRAIKNRLKDSLDLALKRVQWNYKTAIPMYFPRKNKMSLLLPMAIMDDEVIDLALVVEKTQAGTYLGHTILTLEQAYNDARLITRPDSDWLVADKIETTTMPEVEVENE